HIFRIYLLTFAHLKTSSCFSLFLLAAKSQIEASEPLFLNKPKDTPALMSVPQKKRKSIAAEPLILEAPVVPKKRRTTGNVTKGNASKATNALKDARRRRRRIDTTDVDCLDKLPDVKMGTHVNVIAIIRTLGEARQTKNSWVRRVELV